MRKLTPIETEELEDCSSVKLLIEEEGCVAVEATIRELSDLRCGTCCGRSGNTCFVALAEKFGRRRIRGLYDESRKKIWGMPLIKCGERAAKEISEMAGKADGSLRAEGKSSRVNGFYVFEIE